MDPPRAPLTPAELAALVSHLRAEQAEARQVIQPERRWLRHLATMERLVDDLQRLRTAVIDADDDGAFSTGEVLTSRYWCVACHHRFGDALARHWSTCPIALAFADPARVDPFA